MTIEELEAILGLGMIIEDGSTLLIELEVDTTESVDETDAELVEAADEVSELLEEPRLDEDDDSDDEMTEEELCGADDVAESDTIMLEGTDEVEDDELSKDEDDTVDKRTGEDDTALQVPKPGWQPRPQ